MFGRVRESSASSFTSAMPLTEEGLTSVPKRNILPPSLRPKGTMYNTCLPIVDLSYLQHPLLRPQIIQEVHLACKELGFFQVVNHGIPLSVMNDAIDAAGEFFHLPTQDKRHLFSSNVHDPKNMVNYTMAAQKLQEELMELIFESLGLNHNYLHEDIEEGSQVMVVNCYPECPEPDLTLGLPPHTDYGMLTIILQNHQGLQIMDRNEKWHSVPFIEGALVVLLGDHMEVLTNGTYKSVVHRATVNSEKRRISIVSLRSLALGKIVRPASALVNKQNVLAYKEGSLSDFLDFISAENIVEEKYIDKLKINP
ncbi:unnamed protein product [Withania somnifera]